MTRIVKRVRLEDSNALTCICARIFYLSLTSFSEVFSRIGPDSSAGLLTTGIAILFGSAELDCGYVFGESFCC